MKPENASRRVLWNFARLMRSAPRGPMMSDDLPEGSPPERFVEKISDEGGDVYVAPVLEALREALRSKRTPAAEASTDAPEEGTPARRTVARS